MVEILEGGFDMRQNYCIKIFTIFSFLLLCFIYTSSYAQAPISDDTQSCLDCHASLHPGIVEDWRKSAHARSTPAAGQKRPDLERLISAQKVPESVSVYAVGCAECHTMNFEQHKDSFDHADYSIHTVVTPRDCSVCHPVESKQYDENLMSHAYGNLQKNPVYRSLADAVNGMQSFKDMKTDIRTPDAETDADSCFSCHGTEVKVKGSRTRESDFGEFAFPELSGWPNQGVGRINPDGSMGSCSACHTRHRFSMATARKPATCSQCHKGPDVPAYGVFTVSKHGNIYASEGKEWDFKAVPWKVGKDFTAPTCAACHIGLLVNSDGDVVSQRSHRMNDRLYLRIFGLIYAHAHPRSPDTTIIRNKAGLPLPTELTGEEAIDYLIDESEQKTRKENMETVCMSCHGSGWVNGHFSKLENTVKTTNEMTLTATKILMSAWEKGVAKGLQGDSIFNEGIEKKWIEQWLFYANSSRFASAMAGADYGAFANGRWYLSKNIQDMLDLLKLKLESKE
jgi:hydroxylamine dehydrogenase